MGHKCKTLTLQMSKSSHLLFFRIHNSVILILQLFLKKHPCNPWMELLTPHFYSASFHDEYHEHLNLEVLLLEPNAFHSPPVQGLPSVSHLGNFNREQSAYSEHATAPSWNCHRTVCTHKENHWWNKPYGTTLKSCSQNHPVELCPASKYSLAL